MTNEIVVIEEKAATDQTTEKPARSLMDYKPREMVVAATEIANVLNDVIVKQNLFINLNGNKHVKAEAWSTLGTMLSILPREDRVVVHEDGSFEAYVSLVNARTGILVGGGSGFVGMDEANWKRKPAYARRSMAITRATSKAYKTCFSWIIALAGYNPTPAEEMDFLVPEKSAPTHQPIESRVERAQTAVVYDASPKQKEGLRDIFSAQGITDVDTKSKISNALINWKVPFEKTFMEEGVTTALKQLNETGTIGEIPF